jgi:fumarate hydratase class I
MRMGQPESYTDTFVELIRRASTELPADVIEALETGRKAEQSDGLASIALGTILNNVELARESSAPICQDTGTPVVWIHHPVGVSTRGLREDFTAAVREATTRRFLRPNAVNTLTGSNTGDGAGRGIPFLHFDEWDEPRVEVRMILKGGGSENVGTQYKLPDAGLGAGRDLEGVRRVVLDAVVDAQGKGCAPGVLGVCVGGDRVSAFEASKRQLLRPLKDTNPIPELAQLEERLLQEGNELGVGPMGFGGKTTLLAVKIGVLDRLPACYFVTVTYMCWADRRAAVSIDQEGGVTWLS